MTTKINRTKIKNPNEVNTSNFKLAISNLRIDNQMKDFELLCQTANIPGISSNAIRIDNPNNYFNVNSTKMDYETLSITYKIDEDLNNFYQIWYWLHALSAPQKFEQFSEYQGGQNPRSGYTISVDASLFALTNVFNPNIEIVYRNIFPVSLSGVNFDYKSNEIIIGSASFVYDYYEIKKKTVLNN